MSDLPPADWYVDPEDSAQYRYWNGQAWTEHRSPRYSDPSNGDNADESAGTKMRSAPQLVAKTISIAASHWRRCLLASLVIGVGYLAVTLLFLFSASAIIDGGIGKFVDRLEAIGELTEIRERLEDINTNEAAFFLPGEHDKIASELAEINAKTGIYSSSKFDEIQRQLNSISASGKDAFSTGDFDDVLEQLEDFSLRDALGSFDWSPINFLPLALGLLIVWITSNIAKAAVTRLAIAELGGQKLRLRVLINQSLPRVPRLMGLDLKVLGLLAAFFLVFAVLTVFVSPWLALLAIPAWIAVAFYALPVVSLAYVVAASGPSKGSLSYAVRLIRQRFWKSLGRLLLVILAMFAVSIALQILLGLALPGSISVWVTQSVQTLVSIVLGIVLTIAPAILYRDLGGEVDADSENDPGGETELGSWVS